MSERLFAPLDRPLHPWRSRLENLAEGKGNFYHWGPNYTVDLVVITSGDMPAILLIQRGDTGDWALPGGFIDQDETPIEASLRELQEETGLVLRAVDAAGIIYQGPVDDPRSTLNAWPETTALLWRIETTRAVVASDDAEGVAWVSLNELPEKLYGSHAVLIERALVAYGEL